MSAQGSKDDVSRMGKNLAQGMVVVFSLWQTDSPHTWLTHYACTGYTCSSNASTTISNISITEGPSSNKTASQFADNDLLFLTE